MSVWSTKEKSIWSAKADEAVSKFTRDILSVAKAAKVNFDHAGNKGSKADEINRVMKINSKVVGELVG